VITAASVLNAAGLERLDRGELVEARIALEEALEVSELLDDLIGQAEAHNNLGTLARIEGRRARQS
jgi:hypothetical protein